MKRASVVLAAALCAHIAVSTACAAELVSSGLSYRGRLTDGGTPANGLYDMTFKLFDAPTGGSQIGTTINANNARVQDGAMTLDLDFGAQTFAGSSRWLEIGVRSGSSMDAYTALGPRQLVSGAPSTTFAVRPEAGASPGAPPPGAVMYFNLTTCPAGWDPVLGGEGRYIVGWQPGTSIGGTIGSALTPNESRAVGQHSHGINDPGHQHWYSAAVATSTGSGNSKAGYETQLTQPAYTGISIQNEGNVPGTNAPYIVLLMCVKN